MVKHSSKKETTGTSPTYEKYDVEAVDLPVTENCLTLGNEAEVKIKEMLPLTKIMH